jgi:peptide/nickel transport system substrate-binding protein
MTRPKAIGLIGAGAVAALALAACESGGGSPSGPAGFDAATTKIVNPSGHRGGTLSFALSGTPDSTDPGNMYAVFTWNFGRLYEMPLMTYESCPGPCGLRVVPDLATGPGVVSNRGLTWTYHIKPDVRFEDGSTVTAADVKYAIERSYDRGRFPLGPDYYPQLLAPQKPVYPGPYKDRARNLMGLKAVTIPNATTIVFHLAHPFADFNYVTTMPQSAPVPPSRDTRANYQLHPMSTGPYKFASYQPGKQLTLVPNPFWNPATDPNARQLVSKITVALNMNANDIDNRVLAGGLSADLGGYGVQAAARARILSSPALKAHADNPVNGSLFFAYINTRVPPLTNVHCRRAIEYAADKTSLQTAYGGPYAGGVIASTVAPPNLIGHRHFDLYEATTKPHGDLARARAELTACGQRDGFSTGIAYRSDRPAEAAAAQALQASLARAGIKTALHGYPTGTYGADFAGVPAYVHQHDLGIDFTAWLADWPDGYGFFDALVAGNNIRPAGNANIGELNDPVVNNLISKMAAASDAAVRNSYTGQIDMQVMRDAVILPEVYGKSLLYRSPKLTNVYVQQYYGMYNYAVLGLR